MSHWYPAVQFGLLFFFLGFAPMVLFVLRAGAWTYADRFAGTSVLVAPGLMWFAVGWQQALALFGGMASGYVVVHAANGFFPRDEKEPTQDAGLVMYPEPIAVLPPTRPWEKRDTTPSNSELLDGNDSNDALPMFVSGRQRDQSSNGQHVDMCV
jgi:hypothetical protein